MRLGAILAMREIWENERLEKMRIRGEKRRNL